MNADLLVRIAENYLTLHMGAVTVGPVQTSILALALAAVLLSGVHLWRIGRREDRQTRFIALRAARAEPAEYASAATPPWYRHFGSLVAASPIVGRSERDRLQAMLAAAGIKGQGRLASIVAVKVCGAFALATGAWLFLEWYQLLVAHFIARLTVLCGGLMLGWRLPDLVLSRLAARRRVRLELGMPDALDLLVVCAEAGLSLNQAIDQISRDLRASNRYIADEFAATAAEMRVQPDIGVVLDNLVQRTGLETLRGMIATLKQSMRFGTPLAESLRVLAAEMRQARQARMEERTARLPVLLAIPLMMFILPSLLMAVGTPVIIRVLDTVRSVIANLPAAH